MENSIELQWKDFSVPMDRLGSILKNLIGDNYDGMVCDPDQFSVVFKQTPTQTEIDAVTTFWNNAVAEQFSPSLKEIISKKINDASAFGRSLILDAAVENVEMGITQANKTKDVADYCANIQRYLESGSLYAALSELDHLISAGVPDTLAPYITQARLVDYKAKINAYLAS